MDIENEERRKKAAAYRHAYRQTEKYKTWHKKWRDTPEQKRKQAERLTKRRRNPEYLEKAREYVRKSAEKKREEKLKLEEAERAERPDSSLSNADLDRYIEDCLKPRIEDKKWEIPRLPKGI